MTASLALVCALLAAAAPAVADDDDGGHLETAELHALGLDVHVSWHTMTGTTHIAEELTLTTARGKLALAGSDFASEDSKDALHAEALPLIERIVTVDTRHWVLLGWSSFGEGMQSEHVWLVEDRASGPRVTDWLMWTTDRAHAGLALAPKARVIVGVPLPDRSDGLHDEESWQLRHAGDALPLDKVEKLPATHANVMTLPAYYDPPFGDEPSTRRWASRFVWFEASGSKLVMRRSQGH